jgi:hypothetical protein
MKIEAAPRQGKERTMKRRLTDGDRRADRPDTRPGRWDEDASPGSRADRRDPDQVGRRRFDGLSIELLWDRVEKLTRQTQEHADVVDELPALLARIEAGLAYLGICGLPVEVRDPDRHGGVDLDAPPDRVEVCQGTERTADGMVCVSCGGSHKAKARDLARHHV